MRLGIEAGAHTLDMAVELGVKGVPINGASLVKDGVDATLAPLKERGLQVCQIGMFGYNPLSTDAARQAEQAALLEQVIPLASETGCPYIVICGGNYHPSGFGAVDARNYLPEAIDHIAEALAKPLALAERHGVKLSIEPYLKTAIATPDKFLALHRRLGSNALRVNIDVTSFYGYWDLVDPAPMVQRVCTMLGAYCGIGHIKEVALFEGFHLHSGLSPLGTGSTDWSFALAQMASHIPADSWLILEHLLSPEEARASHAYLLQAAAKAGVTFE